ncbi:MAG: hypothetical protein U9R40_06165 [Synergistota bacterium]|nr:hypothetical protein [Synergistota bacterium]
MVYLFIAGAAIIAQVAVTILAFHLIRVTGRHYVWFFLVAAAGFMVFRRTIPFFQYRFGVGPTFCDWLFEISGLLISILLFVGAMWVIPRLSGIARARDEIADECSAVSQIVRDNSIATFVIDNRHRVTQWNRACENLTDVFASYIKGTTEAWSAFYEKQRPTLCDLLLDGATPEAIKQAYSGGSRPSSLVEEGWEAEAFFPNPRGGRLAVLHGLRPPRHQG